MKNYRIKIGAVAAIFVSIGFFNNIYGNECRNFEKKLLKTTLKGIHKRSNDSSYYSAMGSAIQRLHEDKEIGILCRSFLLAKLREDIKGYSAKPTDTELFYYHLHSEYSANLINADIQIGRILLSEGIDYTDIDRFAEKMHETSRQEKTNKNSIPKVLHHIWLTHPNSPREILPADIKTVLKNKELFSKDPIKWRHIVWTNNKTLISNSIKILEQEGVEVISIEDFAENIQLFNLIIDLVDLKLFGAASDILRYSILNHLGGVYADLNFKFNRGVYETLFKYDFLTQDAQNNFFASKPNHIILEKTLEKIQQIAENPEDYECFDKNGGVNTIQFTHHPFVLSILKYANHNDNVDFYLDYHYFYGRDEEDPGPIGVDNDSSSGTWRLHEDL